MARRSLWSKSYGDRAVAKIRVYEICGGMLNAERRLAGRLLDRKSLGHRDRDRADVWATVELGKVRQGHAATADPTPTVRKHLPEGDVAQAGGWADLTSLKTTYEHVDDATLYRVVTEPAELREARA